MKVSVLTLVSTYAIANIAYAQRFQNILLSFANIPEDGRLNFTQLAQKYGCESKEYEVTTADGYILTLFHMPGDNQKPVLVVHGGQDSSDTFLLRGNKSQAVALNKAGYDVWACNLRGNKYSRDHVTLDPDKDKQYWDFSFHESGYYDAPAIIDFILDKTGQKQLRLIGLSQAVAVVLTLGVLRPEYNYKISIFIALAPVVYMQHVGPFMAAAIKSAPFLNNALVLTGQEEILGNHSTSNAFIRAFCTLNPMGDAMRGNILTTISGSKPDAFDGNFLSVVYAHYPCGTSRRNIMHSMQVGMRNKFSFYDYGCRKNYLKYNAPEPPDYDLSKFVMNTSLFVARKDLVSTMPDVDRLRCELPNVVDYRIMAREQMNHYDFSWGLGMEHYLFPGIFEVLDKY